MASYSLGVIGSGIGGYPAAVLAAKEGLRVVVFEKGLVGGECTNYGCVPSKALLHYSNVLGEARRLAGLAGGSSVEKALSYALRVAEDDRRGLEVLLEKAGVEVVHGEAKISPRSDGAYRVRVGSREYVVENLLLAPGSNPLIPGWVEGECRRVLDNRGLYSTRGIAALEGAEAVAVIGGGFIGVEAAQAMARLGLRVDVYEALSRLLPGLDRDLGMIARRLLRALGVGVYTSSPVEKVSCVDGGEKVRVCSGGHCRDYDAVLVALGRRPNTGWLKGLVELDERGYIRVGPHTETSAPRVYAAGDAAGPPLLAHKALAESLTAYHSVAGRPRKKPRVVPQVVYGEPELVQVEDPDARPEDCEGCRVVKHYWGYNAIARIRGVRAQLVYAKLVYEEATGRIVGAYLAGPHASELAGELALAIEKRMTVEDLGGAIHPHPSASEALLETALAALGIVYHRA